MDKFSARETEWMLELDGIPLAGFWRRAFAFVIDWMIVTIIISVLATTLVAVYTKVTHKEPIIIQQAPHSEAEIDKLGEEIESSSEKFKNRPRAKP